MQPPKLPRWSDEKAVAEFEKAVAEFVGEEINESKSEEERQLAMYESYYADRLPPMRKSDLARMHAAGLAADEKSAVTKALLGKLEPLIEFLENPWTIGERLSLAPATRHLIVEFLTGKRSLHTGRPKGMPGRPKMSNEQRRAANPIHDAAEEFLLIKQILKQHYGNLMTAGNINDLADKIAQERAKIKTSVQDYRRRSRKSPQRLK